MNINATLIGQTLAFFLFVWFCKKFVWPPMVNAMQERQTQIADGLAAAEKGQQAQEIAEKEAAQVISDAKSQAAEIIASAENAVIPLLMKPKRQQQLRRSESLLRLKLK